MITIKSAREIARMREAGRIVAEVLDLLRPRVQPGITTGELDELAYDAITERGGKPSFLGYDGFPRSICTSIDEEIVHGIPGRRRLESGSILSIDIGAAVGGYHADAALTVPVGQVSADKMELIAVAEGAFAAGLEQAVAGHRIGDISAAVQAYAEERGYVMVEGLTGHGVGTELHEDPAVPNVGKAGRGPVLRPGMTIAIEPMVTSGSPETVLLDDGWTVVTADRSPAAHYEHTLVITAQGPELLTVRG